MLSQSIPDLKMRVEGEWFQVKYRSDGNAIVYVLIYVCMYSLFFIAKNLEISPFSFMWDKLQG